VVKEILEFIKPYGNKKKKIFPGGHNYASFDSDFIELLFELHGVRYHDYFSKFILDTIEFARLAWGHKDEECTNFKLGTLCDKIGKPLYNAHDALADTVATGDLTKHLIQKMRYDPLQAASSEGQIVIEPKGYKRSFQF
jgi:DNA polymerase III epsilon subunit-like protein